MTANRWTMQSLPIRLTTILIFFTAAQAEAQDCVGIIPAGSPPYTAEDYPLPLSLRANLIFLMKEALRDRGAYEASLTDSVFTTLLEAQIRQLQASRGEAQTGCITWDLVRDLDPLGREPPAESTQ
jgi:hypothetical protein